MDNIMMGKIFCFGELLIRLSPDLGNAWIAHTAMPAHIGGAELNVAQALVNWGLPVKYSTALPNNWLSQNIVAHLQQKQIDSSAVQYSGQRIGLYYLPQGTDLKNASVIYDRAGSSFATLTPGTIDWESLLQGCDWFHCSAICPAVSQHAAYVTADAMQAARARGITVSIDLNYRSKLWQYGQAPQQIMPNLMQYCDVVMGNLWSVESLLGIPTGLHGQTDVSDAELVTVAAASMQLLQQQYPTVHTMAYNFRFDDRYFAVLHQNKETIVAPTKPLGQVVDKVGSGDCFMAALIYAIKSGYTNTDIIAFAVSAAMGKLGEKGDSTKQTVLQIKQRMYEQ
jgi:2-dehydro-3-deoxygluconokinase